MSYAKGYLSSRTSFEPAPATLRIQCPCCEEILEIGIPGDCPVTVMEQEDEFERVCSRERKGQIPLTMAARKLDYESMRIAMAGGWKLPSQERPAWLEQELPGQTGGVFKSLLGIVLGSLAALLACLGIYFLASITIKPSERQALQIASSHDQTLEGRSEASRLADEARETLRGFFAATTAEAKLSFVNDAARVAPALRSYYEKHGMETGISAEEFVDSGELVSDEDTQRGVTILARAPQTAVWSSNVSGPATTPVPSQPAAGKAQLYFFIHGKLDWETYAQHQRSALRAFVKYPQASSQVFRVAISYTGKAEGDSQVLSLFDVCADPQLLAEIDFKQLPAHVIGKITSHPAGGLKLATLELASAGQGAPALTIKRFVCWESLGITAGTP